MDLDFQKIEKDIDYLRGMYPSLELSIITEIRKDCKNLEQAINFLKKENIVGRRATGNERERFPTYGNGHESLKKNINENKKLPHKHHENKKIIKSAKLRNNVIKGGRSNSAGLYPVRRVTFDFSNITEDILRQRRNNLEWTNYNADRKRRMSHDHSNNMSFTSEYSYDPLERSGGTIFSADYDFDSYDDTFNVFVPYNSDSDLKAENSSTFAPFEFKQNKEDTSDLKSSELSYFYEDDHEPGAYQGNERKNIERLSILLPKRLMNLAPDKNMFINKSTRTKEDDHVLIDDCLYELIKSVADTTSRKDNSKSLVNNFLRKYLEESNRG